MNREQKMVLKYHELMGFTVNDLPTIPDKTRTSDRAGILQEEVDELKEALESNDILKACDALADVLYVVYGTAIACGIDMEEPFEEIHRSNMTKDSPPGQLGKAVKGDLYSSPRLDSILNGQRGILTGE